MPVAEYKAKNKLSTRDSTPLNPVLAVGDTPIPKEINPWGLQMQLQLHLSLENHWEGGRVQQPGGRAQQPADQRKEESKLLLRNGWPGTSSAAVIYYLHYRKSWKLWRTSGSP